LVVAAFAVPALSAEIEPRAQPLDAPVLLVEINVPIMWRPFLEEDIEQAFAERFERVFRERGFTGRLRVIADADQQQPRARLSILSLYLNEWRVDRAGQVQCRFTASIRTAAGQKDLGSFAATSFDWAMDRSRWILRQSLDEVARQALNDLYDELAASKLLPTAMTR
jgi:hypothetical protein